MWYTVVIDPLSIILCLTWSNRQSSSMCLETSRLVSSSWNEKWFRFFLIQCIKFFKLLFYAQANSFGKSASSLIEVGRFLSNKTSPAKVTALRIALAGILPCKIKSVTATQMKSQICALSTSWTEVVNTIMISAMTLLPQHHSWFIIGSRPVDRALSRWRLLRSKRWEETNLSRASQTQSLPVDHSPGLVYRWKTCPCEYGFLPTVAVSKTNSLDMIAAPWWWPCSSAAMWITFPFWSSHYNILGERLSTSILFSLFQFWVWSASSMSVKNKCPSCCSVNFRTTSMSWDLREVLGNVNEFTILFFGKSICWAQFPNSLTETNWY